MKPNNNGWMDWLKIVMTFWFHDFVQQCSEQIHRSTTVLTTCEREMPKSIQGIACLKITIRLDSANEFFFVGPHVVTPSTICLRIFWWKMKDVSYMFFQSPIEMKILPGFLPFHLPPRSPPERCVLVTVAWVCSSQTLFQTEFGRISSWKKTSQTCVAVKLWRARFIWHPALYFLWVRRPCHSTLEFVVVVVADVTLATCFCIKIMDGTMKKM